MFGRSRFAKLAAAQLDLFLREQRDVVADAEQRLAAYNRAERSDAEELYGDYVDALETGAEILAEMRDHYARTLDDADEYVHTFNRAVAKRLPAYAAAVESL
jgi:FMN phosphatase YigB (HAD superfamily)